MAKELAKQYDPSEVEDRTYKFWCDKKYFHAKKQKNIYNSYSSAEYYRSASYGPCT